MKFFIYTIAILLISIFLVGVDYASRMNYDEKFYDFTKTTNIYASHKEMNNFAYKETNEK